MEADVGREGIAPLENSARLSGGGSVTHDQLDPLVFSEVADDLGINPRDGLEFARPIPAIVRPCQPCGGVRFPFGRHAVVGRRRTRDLSS